mgnify:CR=1 FL=1
MHEEKNPYGMGIFLLCIFGGQDDLWQLAGQFYVHRFGPTQLTRFAQRILLSLLKKK